jgi:hypothetical protein
LIIKPSSRAEALLYELCLTYGYCLPPDDEAALLADIPEDADAFVDAVLKAEGLDAMLLDRGQRHELREVIRDWLFDDGRGRGTKSGLPRLPFPD